MFQEANNDIYYLLSRKNLISVRHEMLNKLFKEVSKLYIANSHQREKV